MVARRRLGHLRGAALGCAAGLIATAGLLAVHLVPAMLGAMTRGTVVVAALALAAGSLLVRPGPVPTRTGPERPDPAPPPDQTRTAVLAAIALGAVAINVLTFLRLNADVPILHVDAVSFHLPDVATWIRDGSIWSNNEFIPQFPTGTYPSNGDVMFLAAALPFHNDAFVRLVDLPFLGLLGLAVYALGVELGAPRTLAALFAAALLSIRAVTSFAVDQVVPDVVLLATLAAGALFLVRHFRTRRRAELVLAGVGLGIAFGSKWYGLSVVAVVLACWAVASLLAGRGRRVVGRHGAALVGLVLACGGVWLLRNWVVTGNPLFPLKVELGGVAIFDAPRNVLLEQYGYTILDRVGQWSVWGDSILPDWRLALGAPAALIGLLATAGLVAVMRARSTLGRRPAPDGTTAPPGAVASARTAAVPVAMLAAATLLVAAVYTITPATSQGFASGPFRGLTGGNSRYVVPAFVLGAPVAAWLVARLGRLRPVAEVLALLAVLDGLRVTFALSPGALAVTLLVLVALGRLGASLVTPALRRKARRTRVLAAVASGLLALAGLVALGNELQERFNDDRY
ncbi:MAG TPA: phospholipid carrier-dependent glycosyltransferase, partial [Thermoleophilaceae bacterium]